MASFYGHLDIMELLIENGALINALDADSRTPLHWAAHEGHTGAVELLLRHDADWTIRESTGLLARQEAELAEKFAAAYPLSMREVEVEMYAFIFGTHPRLGASSPVRLLPRDVLELILHHLKNVDNLR
eukprot:c19470_g1_i8.p1 GENE.c19470_g1_i8~~c19470_g1_i8.p1  ORF type:complete len:129 (-),score=13.53 c19470_g1_i8:136-522(-)